MAAIPPPLARTRELMYGYSRPWFLCGGWAVDAWIGHQTRKHLDVDVAVFREDQQELYAYLAGWHLVGHDRNVADDSTESWNGRCLDLPAHIHANHPAMNGTELDIQLNATANGDWLCRSEPSITHPLSDSATARWDLPTAPPELVLFYKAGGNLAADQVGELRSHDELDMRALLPLLTAGQRSWLHNAIARSHPTHPWLAGISL